MNHYPRHIGDWMRDTAHLSEMEECYYSRLVDQYYIREKPLPVVVEQCCRLVRAASAAARRIVASVLTEFFVLQDDGWHQKRCDEELAAFRARSESARVSARASVEARKRARDGPANVERTLNESLNERSTDVELASSHKPIASSQKPEPEAMQPEVASPTPKSKPLAEGVKKRPPSAASETGANGKHEAKTAATARAYGDAYQDRYGVAPTFNSRTNGQLAQFIDRIGAEESPHVAAHFVQSNRGLYVAAKHSTNLLLRDAEALRTEWATRTHGTDFQARTADRGGDENPFLKIKREQENARNKP